MSARADKTAHLSDIDMKIVKYHSFTKWQCKLAKNV